MTNDVKALIEAVEAGTFLDDITARQLGMTGDYNGLPIISTMYRAFSGSLDAAKALHEALLPGWVARPKIGGAGAGVTVWHCEVEEWDSGHEVCADNMPCPARSSARLVATHGPQPGEV